jgi:hypothetical protein
MEKINSKCKKKKKKKKIEHNFLPPQKGKATTLKIMQIYQQTK